MRVRACNTQDVYYRHIRWHVQTHQWHARRVIWPARALDVEHAVAQHGMVWYDITYVYIYIYIYTYLYTHICIYMYIYIYIYTHVYVYTYHVYIRIHMLWCVCVYIYIYIHIHTITCIHTYIYIYICIWWYGMTWCCRVQHGLYTIAVDRRCSPLILTYGTAYCVNYEYVSQVVAFWCRHACRMCVYIYVMCTQALNYTLGTSMSHATLMQP